jgi:hypothetical protein
VRRSSRPVVRPLRNWSTTERIRHACLGETTLPDEVLPVFIHAFLNRRQRLRQFGLEHSNFSEDQDQPTDGRAFRVVYNTGVPGQELLDRDFAEIFQLNALFLKPPAEPGDGVRLAWHRRWHEPVSLNSSKINIQILRQRSNPEALEQHGIND